MKYPYRRFLLIAILIVFLITAANYVAVSQPPPPPAGGLPGGGHNANANQGAPLVDGVWILLSQSIGYLFFKVLQKKEIPELYPDKPITH
jgi:hypothetical protein